MSPFIYNAFTPAAIIAMANNELAKAQIATRVKCITGQHDSVLPGLIQATSTRGARMLIHVWNYGNRHETACVRAIHRLSCKSGRFSLLPNGQPTGGLDTYLFNGENGQPYVVSDSDISDFAQKMLNGVEASRVQVYIAQHQSLAAQACAGDTAAIRLS